ncbi:MAG: hydroxymethylglutaryl-CoA lyase [Vicinamibacterales bacterium]
MPTVLIHEVGMRDGLQVEQAIVPIERKFAWIEALVASGVDVVQAGSFVNPAVVPQMADTDAVFRHFNGRRTGKTRLSALVLNEKGLDRGLAAGVTFFCMGVSASDTHSRKNTGLGTADAMTRVLGAARRAVDAGVTVQLSVQSAFGCGYEGAIPMSRVLEMAQLYLDAGFRTVSLADTAGHATPDRVKMVFERLMTSAPDASFACHFHDAYGLAMANACAALEMGVRSFETAFAGLGGCPFTAVASGNLCTEDFVHMLQMQHLRTDIDLAPLVDLAREAEAFFERLLPGNVYRVGARQCQ